MTRQTQIYLSQTRVATPIFSQQKYTTLSPLRKYVRLSTRWSHVGHIMAHPARFQNQNDSFFVNKLVI